MPIPFDRFRLLNGTKKKVENVSYRRQPPETPTNVEVSYDGFSVVDTIYPGDRRSLDPGADEIFLRNEDGTPIEIVLDTGKDVIPSS